MPHRLRLTQNAQLYKIVSPITQAFLRQVLDTASSNIQASSPYIIDLIGDVRNTPNSNQAYSLSVRVYASERDVLFLEPPLADTIYAYIILILIDGYAAILSKSCANFSDVIEDTFEPIPPNLLNSALIQEGAEVQKLNLRNLAVSNHAVRTRSYEAADLKGIISPATARRAIPRYARLKSQGKTKSLTSGSSRVVEHTLRKEIDDIVEWVEQQINLIKTPLNPTTFFEKFATTTNLSEIVSTSNCIALLIESHRLFEMLEEDSLDIKFETKRGRLKKISEKTYLKLRNWLELTYEIEGNRIIYDGKTVGKMRVNVKTISFDSKLLGRFKVVVDGKAVSLQSYINKNKLFTIAFDNPSYLYFDGMPFKDSSILSSIEDILKMLQPKPSFNIVQSEKGDINRTSTDFSNDSLFKQIEVLHSQDDVIFCDDLGDEWADHISFNFQDKSISFIHSKHGKDSVTASGLHDVVGQGIKNFGNMSFQADDIRRKYKNKFATKYRKSGISRVRKGTVPVLSKPLIDLLSDFQTRRKCILSCSFLSKDAIEKSFKKLKKKQPVKGQIIQLLWILICFQNEAREASIEPIVYCRP